MSTRTQLIQDAFVTLVKGVEGIESALDHEPGIEGLGKRPCVTMIPRAPTVIGEATGGFVDVEHSWDCFLYVDVRRRFRDPQIEIGDLMLRIQLAVMGDVTLAGACEWAHVEFPDEEPQYVAEQGHAWKRFELRAQQGETT